jgi:protein regulator of cytokinesis 1
LQAEEEIHRLDELKVSRMKELVIKKQSELNDVYTDAHMEPDSDASCQNIIAIIESGL